MPIVLLDASAIVALLKADDPWHQWAVDTIGAIKPPVYSCEAALAEASHLLRKVRHGRTRVLELVIEGKVRLRFDLDAEALPVRTLMHRYQSVPMSLADACLVRLTELEARATVVTLDSNFRIYRRSGRGVIPLITPS